MSTPPNIFRRVIAAVSYVVTGVKATRGFNAAQLGRLYADWFAAATSSDTEIRSNFRRLLDRSRDLERNSDYWRGYLGDAEDNIVGAVRDDLRMNCGSYSYPNGKPPKWEPDQQANNLIEADWAEWGKKGTCTICGRYSWWDVKRLLVRATPRDGNFIARKIFGKASRNRFGYALQIWEIDHLDLLRFETLAGGNEIRFGIEFDSMKRPVAYWLMATHPGDSNGVGNYSVARSTRFRAEEVYHVYMSERSEQSIGIPWCVSAITRLRQLGAFEEAAVIAARLGASKSIFFKKTPSAGSGPGAWTGEKTANGSAVMDVSPGTAQELPDGWDIADYSPEYPNVETSSFRQAMIMGMATSLRTSYISLGNDLSAVNYSSARVGLLDERETWKMHQFFYDIHFKEPVFADWLMASLMNGATKLPVGKFDQFNRPIFKGRRWVWIDPLKDMQAAQTGIALRLTSRRQLIDENGGDVEEVFHANKADEELADSMELSLQPAAPAPEAFGQVLDDSESDPAPAGKPPAKKKAA